MQENDSGKKRVRGWTAKSVADIKRRLGRTLALVERREIDLPTARVIISGANAMLLAHRVEVTEKLEARIEALEKNLKGGNRGNS